MIQRNECTTDTEYLGEVMSKLPKLKADGSIASYSASSSHIYIQIKKATSGSLFSKLFGTDNNEQ